MATDFVMFNEGSQYLLAQGIPATCYFLLSTSSCNAAGGSAQLTATSTLAGGVGEIPGTGYGRQSQAAPAVVGGTVSFAQMTWATNGAVNWPSNVRAIMLVTTPDNSGSAICAWNLQGGGAARDLSAANTTEQVTPTLTTSS